jgi:hypothetical protein
MTLITKKQNYIRNLISNKIHLLFKYCLEEIFDNIYASHTQQ